jgi:hypothetical protein
MTDDPIIQRIESFRCRRGQLLAQRRNRGYTPNRASSSALVARFGPVMRAWNGGHGHAMVEWMPPPDRAWMVCIRRETSYREGEEDDESWCGLSADRTRR